MGAKPSRPSTRSSARSFFSRPLVQGSMSAVLVAVGIAVTDHLATVKVLDWGVLLSVAATAAVTGLVAYVQRWWEARQNRDLPED